jgi:hypothetical protein
MMDDYAPEIDDLAEKLVFVVNQHRDKMRDDDRLIATLMLVSDFIGGIECPHCRANAAKAARHMFTKLVEQSTEEAARRPPGSHHTH